MHKQQQNYMRSLTRCFHVLCAGIVSGSLRGESQNFTLKYSDSGDLLSSYCIGASGMEIGVLFHGSTQARISGASVGYRRYTSDYEYSASIDLGSRVTGSIKSNFSALSMVNLCAEADFGRDEYKFGLGLMFG